jgi:hypothetical protein
MANNNPHYHQWLFTKPAAPSQSRITIAYPSAPYEYTVVSDPRAPLEHHNTVRKRIEILEEARLLKYNLTDLW